MTKHSMEWNEILGDMVDDVREDESRTVVHEAVAAEQELTSADLDDWYQQLIDEAQRQEEIEIWADFWKDHKDNA
jgi:hypothetical protein